MKRNFIKRMMALTILSVSLLGITSVQANAEWRKSGSNTWEFLDQSKVTSCVWLHDKDTGKTYFTNMMMDIVKGWVIIDSKWYYFNQDGSLAKNTIIDGKYQVGSDGSWNNGKLNEGGIISLFSYDISNGNIIGTHNENNTNLIVDKKISKESIKNVEDLKTYLNDNYSSLKTPIGTLKFDIAIDENDDKMYPYDFKIETNWGTIENSKYDLYSFSPYDLEKSIKISNNDKEKTIDLLKEYQRTIAKVSMDSFPKKKIKGGFYDGWFKYKYIHEGYESIKFCSWNNYTVDEDIHDFSFNDYDKSNISGFNWDTEDDDYFNNYNSAKMLE